MSGLVGQGLAEGSASHLIPQMEGTGKVQLEGSSCEKKTCIWGGGLLGLDGVGERNA